MTGCCAPRYHCDRLLGSAYALFCRSDTVRSLTKLIEQLWGKNWQQQQSSEQKAQKSPLWLFDVNSPHTIMEGNTLLNLAARSVGDNQ